MLLVSLVLLRLKLCCEWNEYRKKLMNHGV